MSGILTHSPADICRRVLIAIGQGSAPDGGAWPVYADEEPSSPDNCITLYDTVGRLFARVQYDGSFEELHGIQVRIRAATPKVGYTKARAVAIALDTAVYRVAVVMDGITYCVHSIGRTGDVMSLGKDVPKTRRRVYTVNALASIRQV